MISNLRYFFDHDKLIVKWNYEDVTPQVMVTCRLVKRIDPRKEISRETDYTMEAYHSAGGGAIFDLPHIPIIIELFDQARPSEIQRCAVNSPYRYRIEPTLSIRDEKTEEVENYGLFGWGRRTRTISTRKMKASLVFSDLLEEDELAGIEPWIVCGVYQSGCSEERFFWPGPFHSGENRLTEVVIPNNISKDNFRIELVPEAEKSKYEGLFELGDSNVVEHIADDAQQNNITPIDLERLKPRMENGLYRVICPFCLDEFKAEEAIFRSKVYPAGTGYPAEKDESFAKPLNESYRLNIEISDKNMGAVLAWDNKRIKEYALAENPNKFIAYTNPKQIVNKVIVAVKDEYGNVSRQKICPHCHYPLPAFSGKYPTVFINMMGNTACGKTIYLARTISMLKERKLLPGYELSLTMNANAESQRYENEFDIISGRLKAKSGVQPANSPFEKKLPQDHPRREEPHEFKETPATPPRFEANLSQERRNAAPGGRTSQRSGGMAGLSRTNLERIDLKQAEESAPNAEKARREIAEPPRRMNERSLQRVPAFQKKTQTAEKDPQSLFDATSVEYLEPCVCELRNEKNGDGLILALFDFPGELVTRNRKQLHQYEVYYEKLLLKVDGMIFLFDPMTLDRIRNLGEEKQKQFSEKTYVSREGMSEQLLADNPSKILAYFKKKFCPQSQLQFPIVCAVSKSDAIRDYLPKLDANMAQMDMRFLDESNFAASSDRVGIDLQEINANSEKVLQFAGDQQLAINSESIAENYIWMCISAIGIAPVNGSLKGRYGNPVWMMAPLEWILYKNQTMVGSID